MRGITLGLEVRGALGSRLPVVALESTIFSELGLPAPANRECFERVLAAARDAGAVPALTGVLDGQVIVGADEEQASRLRDCAVKVAAQDLGRAVANGLRAGATTVSAAVTLAAASGIGVMATGGIGGVHRGAESSGDVSHDLFALARHRVVVVSSGAKAFLDLPKTLQFLETLGVPVLGWRTTRFPAFYLRDSGLELAGSVNNGADVAAAMSAGAVLGHPTGILVSNPVPVDAELDPELLAESLEVAEAAALATGVSGADVTPAVLSELAKLTGGTAVQANMALAESNAEVAAEIAVALAS